MSRTDHFGQYWRLIAIYEHNDVAIIEPEEVGKLIAQEWMPVLASWPVSHEDVELFLSFVVFGSCRGGRHGVGVAMRLGS